MVLWMMFGQLPQRPFWALSATNSNRFFSIFLVWPPSFMTPHSVVKFKVIAFFVSIPNKIVQLFRKNQNMKSNGHVGEKNTTVTHLFGRLWHSTLFLHTNQSVINFLRATKTNNAFCQLYFLFSSLCAILPTSISDRFSSIV